MLLTIQLHCRKKFFKTKDYKKLFTTTMSQDRFNGLAILSIETDLVAKLEYTNLIVILHHNKQIYSLILNLFFKLKKLIFITWLRSQKC